MENRKSCLHYIQILNNYFTLQKVKAALEQRIRDLETDVDLQSARAEATAAALHIVEDQRAADTTAVAEQHREELTAAQSMFPFTKYPRFH